MSRILWLFGAGLGALLMTLPANAIDAWIVSEGWFPKNPHYGGMSGLVFSSMIAVSIPKSRARQWLAGTMGFAAALFFVWASRYLLGLADPAAFTTEQSQAYTQIHWVFMFGIGASAGWISTMSLKQGRFWLVQLLLVILSILIADFTVGSLGIDASTMNRVLYYQTVEIEVHQPVDDAELLYGLKPGSRLGGEGPWGLRTVSVNQWGARSPEYTKEKPTDRERTLVFGGSTLYGAGVSNEHTTPGMMDTLLGHTHEVWNFGVCAYNTAQSAHLAKEMIGTLDPDRIIIMITNTGRRAFMGGPQHQYADKSRYFKENPYLYLENFPPEILGEKPHQRLLMTSALYRTYAAWHRANTDPDTTYADRADRAAVAELEKEAATRGVEVLYVLSPSRGSEIGPLHLAVPQARWLDLNIPGRSGDYQQAHPSPAILTEYAARIVEWLQTRN